MKTISTKKINLSFQDLKEIYDNNEDKNNLGEKMLLKSGGFEDFILQRKYTFNQRGEVKTRYLHIYYRDIHLREQKNGSFK